MKRAATSTSPSVIAVILVLALVVVGVVAVVGFGTNGATAIEVGDQTVSRESVNDELRAIAENQDLVDSQGAGVVTRTNGSVTEDAAIALVMHGLVQEALMKQYLDQKSEHVTAEDRAAGEELYRSGFGKLAAGFSDWYHERVAERLAVYSAFARVTGIDLESDGAGADVASELRPLARRVGVTVDPRYGRYNPRRVTVVPYALPAGLLDGQAPAQASG
jgi:hypothetical protein